MVTIDWAAAEILVSRAELTLVGTDPISGREIRSLDIDAFRRELNDLQDDEVGMPFPTTHAHVAPITVGGVDLARVVEILAPYRVTFEDGQYGVDLVGANSNIGDVATVNQVSIRPNNSAGLVTVDVGGGTGGSGIRGASVDPRVFP